MTNRSDLEPRRKCQERTWDFARELRSLRDSCARSRTEEMQALRRSSEEVERCVLRRQLDESAVLQDFLAGLHEDIESRLEDLQGEVLQRLELLEDRMSKAESEGTRVSLGDAVALEVQRAVSEAFLQVEKSADAAVVQRPSAGDPSNSEVSNAEDDTFGDTACWEARLQRLGTKLVAAGEQSARVAANEVAQAEMAATLPELQRRWSEEAEAQRCHLEMAQEALSLEAQVVRQAALKSEAISAEVEVLKPHLAERLARLGEELQEADMSTQQLRSEFREVCEQSHNEELRSAEAQRQALGRLEESLWEALSRHCSEAMDQAHEAQCRCEVLEQSLMEEAERGRAGRVSWSESSEAAALLGQDLEAAKEHFQREHKELRQELIRGQRELSNELKPQFAELTSALLRGQELTEEAQKAVARCDAAWRPEVKDLRQECQSSFSYLRSQAAVTQKTLEQLETEKMALAKGLRELQRQGVSHEWRVPRLQQRLEYLSMDSKDSKGVWIDSPDFELAGLGPFVLRFYPRGVCGGDGLCAVGVFAPNRAGRAALPLRLDLRISDLRKRASAQSEADGVLWLAHSFSTLESLRDELQIGVDIPPFAWSALERGTRPKEPLNSAPTNPFCKTANELPGRQGCWLPVDLESVVRRNDAPVKAVASQEATPGGGPTSDTREGHRSVPNSPHGSSSSASRPGWAAFGGEELPKRPFSAHVPRSCVSQPMPVLLGSQRRSGAPPSAGVPAGSGGRSAGNPFANERSEKGSHDASPLLRCGSNPFDK